MDVLRSLLLLPALDTAAAFGHADAIVIDLEEGLPPASLEAARAAASSTAAALRADHRQVWVRIHPTGTLRAKADIRATAGDAISGYVLPNALSANHIRYVSGLLRDAEEDAGLKQGTLRLIALIESAAGLLATREMSRASGRLVALALDGVDFCADMGVERTREGHELQYARSHIAVCARAAGLLALDTPFPFTREMQGLLADTAAARAVGMHGKFIVAAEQAPLVNAIFRPSADEVAYARRLHAAHEDAIARGDELAHLDGRVIDAPRARRARRLIDLATAIEAKEGQAAV